MSVLLYNRSCYSLLASSIRISQLVDFACQNGYRSIGITDTNVMFAHMEFLHACLKKDIKPLFGMETYYQIEERKYPVIIYARNNDGYREMMKLSYKLNKEADHLTVEELNSLSNDLFIIYPVVDGYLQHLYSHGSIDDLNAFFALINKANVFIGINNNMPLYVTVNREIKQLCDRYQIRTIAMPLAVYPDRESYESYKVLCAIKQGTLVSDDKLRVHSNCHLKTQQEIFDAYDADSVRNTDILADSCNVTLPLEPKASLPVFRTPDNAPQKLYLTSLTHAGLKKRFSNRQVPEEYVRRLNYELKVITDMGFENYFLIVWDLILYARRNKVAVGVGRGSSAGSLVAYCLGITHIDPIKYGLLFERFLNPERISLPDIDIDFPDNKREFMIEYVRSKYGNDHVSHIIAFGTLAARQVLKDAGKACGVTSIQVNILTKALGNSPQITLKQAYNGNSRFRTAVNASDGNRKLFEIAEKLEGLPRHTTTHAAGIVFTERPLIENVPLIDLDSQTHTTQFVHEYLEELGLIKMDFLALRNLTTISEMTDEISQSEPLDILKIPLDDDKTYKLLAAGNTAGIFQLESEGMKKLLMQMKVSSFDELVAAIALYRPGPMENIPAYLDARNNNNNIRYAHPDLKKILEPTYGIMIYQEQIMQVTQIVAGFSLGKADILRKAISKKNNAEMIAMENDFVESAISRGYPKETAIEIFEDIKKFANYGFNKSHSVAYGMTAYQMAYIKANYPMVFYRSLLNSVIGNDNKTNEYIIEARKNGLNILPPDVNESDLTYILKEDNIRYPLTNIKGIGRINANIVINERQEKGSYEDYFDFVVRCKNASLPNNIFEILIKVGACDCFKLTRNTMLNGFAEACRYKELVSYSKDGQTMLDFDLVSKPLLTIYPDNPFIDSRNELELIGFYLQGHPCQKYRASIPDTVTSLQIPKIRGAVRVIVMITSIREHRIKSGEMMCFLSGYDEMGKMDLVMMPQVYRFYADKLAKNVIIYVQGTVDDRQSVKINRMEVLEGESNG